MLTTYRTATTAIQPHNWTHRYRPMQAFKSSHYFSLDSNFNWFQATVFVTLSHATVWSAIGGMSDCQRWYFQWSRTTLN